MDPPAHRQHRDLISAPYQKDAAALREDTIRALTRQLMAPMLASGELAFSTGSVLHVDGALSVPRL